MNMPTYERRFYIQMFKEEMEEKQEKMEEMKKKNKTSGGKGTRTSSISGEALKSKMRNNEIPQG